MLETYRGGYKKALLDLLNLQEHEMFKVCRSKKQYQTMIKTLLEQLLENPENLDLFMEGNAAIKVHMESCKVVGLKRKGV